MIELDKIYCEDCLETLAKMEDDSIDLIITSPPYNKTYWNKLNKSNFHRRIRKVEYGNFGDDMDEEEYEKWQRHILDECIRVIKTDGSIWYNHTNILSHNRSIHPTYVWDYPVRQMIVWNKGSSPNVINTYFFPTCEWFFWITKAPSILPYFDKAAADMKGMVWQVKTDTKTNHPASFPIELPSNIIKCCSKEGDIVYDPFMGSGTVAKAARDLNRHYIGSELNPDYIIMANERLGIL